MLPATSNQANYEEPPSDDGETEVLG
jgi:hypothetical protein